ncbi:hypothetical protein ASPWEDRAFT_151946 [Aspergillus wentii DTO 134E9]|uniref:Rhodopsin domain-containing protein n=1 Tax=Aspergillus wentii DTO 134E9 TaxID=1073089 RepID=A0A1L9RNN4_ASPWE|nr:uncharacterized protein ASPWEDRAFT_151946 [Aspergillus wentii DTO 134E9]KAI9934355.1 hypothetical protein MW887_005432 [Aspergillus wentii]OJJ36502.1 hypothetical protein ASPWEDRAFT_151946 [Aspergillus wentii DTO 134E9]
MTIYADNAPSVAGSVIMLTSVALITYALRVYCRLTCKSWAAEDWIMTSAVIPFGVLVAGCVGGAFNGIGIHAARLEEPGNEKYFAGGQKFFLMFEVGYCAAIIPIKLSISFMLIRVAEGRKVYIHIQYVLIAVFVTMNVVALIIILINCIPIAAAWDPSLLEKGGHCQDPHVLADAYYACTAVNIVTDWTTALMPIPLLWNVHLKRNTKISIICLMSLGIFASLSACVRLKYTVNLTDQTDFLFGVANVVIWGFAENAIGMIVGNVATLRPLFRISGSRKPSGNYYSSEYANSRSRGFFSSKRSDPTMLVSLDDLELGRAQSQSGTSHHRRTDSNAVAEGAESKNQKKDRNIWSRSDKDSQKSSGPVDIFVDKQVTITYH